MYIHARAALLLCALLLYVPVATLAQGPVIVELFTSQGCSSCPPADKLINSLTNQKDIIPLAFHVDYWNYLGWKDPFSQPQFSERQRAYAAHTGSGSVYTPQLIVNGQKEMVGSSAGKATSAIDEAIHSNNTATIELHIQNINDGKVSLSYSLPALSGKTMLHIALVQKYTTTQILRGENQGKQLINNNVVTSFSTLIAPQKQGSVEVNIPAQISHDNLFVVLYAQNNADYHIVAAGKVSL
jgi:hypothetical protein